MAAMIGNHNVQVHYPCCLIVLAYYLSLELNLSQLTRLSYMLDCPCYGVISVCCSQLYILDFTNHFYVLTQHSFSCFIVQTTSVLYFNLQFYLHLCGMYFCMIIMCYGQGYQCEEDGEGRSHAWQSAEALVPLVHDLETLIGITTKRQSKEKGQRLAQVVCNQTHTSFKQQTLKLSPNQTKLLSTDVISLQISKVTIKS